MAEGKKTEAGAGNGGLRGGPNGSGRGKKWGPLPIGLAALALLGWLVAVWLLVDRSNREQDFTLRIGTLEDQRAQLERTLAEQSAAVGTVQELEAQIVALREDAQPLVAERDQLAAKLETTPPSRPTLAGWRSGACSAAPIGSASSAGSGCRGTRSPASPRR